MRYFRRLFKRPNHVKDVVCLADPSYIAYSHYGVVVLNDSYLSQICDAVYPRWINGCCGVVLNINNGTFLNSLKGVYTRWLTSYCCDAKDLHLKKWVF